MSQARCGSPELAALTNAGQPGDREPARGGGRQGLPPRHVAIELDFGGSDDLYQNDDDDLDNYSHDGYDDHNTSCRSSRATQPGFAHPTASHMSIGSKRPLSA